MDEQLNLVIEQGDGIILIMGCTNKDIVNTVEGTLQCRAKGSNSCSETFIFTELQLKRQTLYESVGERKKFNLE